MSTKLADPRNTLIAPADLATRWRQKPQTIYNKLSAGTLGVPVIRLPGGDPRIRLSDVIRAELAWTKRTPPESSGPICKLCNGSGQNPNTSEICERCGGSGYEPAS